MTPNVTSTFTAKHESKRCPRCDAPFVCRVGDVVNCQCSEISVDESGRERAKQRLRAAGIDVSECLCANCLRELAAV